MILSGHVDEAVQLLEEAFTSVEGQEHREADLRLSLARRVDLGGPSGRRCADLALREPLQGLLGAEQQGLRAGTAAQRGAGAGAACRAGGEFDPPGARGVGAAPGVGGTGLGACGALLRP